MSFCQVKVRTDLYIFRTRSLEDAIEEDANDERTVQGCKRVYTYGEHCQVYS